MIYMTVLDKKFEREFDGVVAYIYELCAIWATTGRQKKQLK